MSRLRDLTGQRFGRLVVKQRGYKENYHNAVWECVCDCGKSTVVAGNHLTCGHVLSCGCLGKEHATAAKVTHGGSRSRLYGVWASMKTRCYTPSATSYQRYGARGIRVCDEWRESFAAFQKWALENGYDETAPRGVHTIDRIDPYGDYSPTNCRLISISEQQKNKRKRGRQNA